MLKLWIICYFVFVVLDHANSDSCLPETFRQASECGNLWGNRASTGYNFTTTIQYCRDSDRADIGQCITDAYAGCPEAIPESYADLFPRKMEMLSKGLAYLCSKVETIEENEACLSRNSRSMRQCVVNALRLTAEEHGEVRFDSLSWEEQRSFRERVARLKEECKYDLLKIGCNTEIANIIGNFFYAFYTYIYE